ncbi:hypothetical protein DIPPA_70112b, partial [Diplonema papillatum]
RRQSVHAVHKERMAAPDDE